jgi:hypothetical protein
MNVRCESRCGTRFNDEKHNEAQMEEVQEQIYNKTPVVVYNS